MNLLTRNDFQLFSLPLQFTISEAALTESFLKLQSVSHPDRFVSGTDSERRLSLQLATRVNEAYQRLRHPLSRARYLCELAGVAIDAETNTAMPSHFLIEQMEWRETLDEASSPEELTDLRSQVFDKQNKLLAQIELSIDGQNNYIAAADLVRQLMFVEKFAADLAN